MISKEITSFKMSKLQTSFPWLAKTVPLENMPFMFFTISHIFIVNMCARSFSLYRFILSFDVCFIFLECVNSVVIVIQVVVACIHEQHLSKSLHHSVFALNLLVQTVRDILFRYKLFLQNLTNAVKAYRA